MSRTVSQYFNVLGAKGEQRLVEDLIIESIRINGMQVQYIPRTLVNFNSVFGEDPLSRFDKTLPIEMYFDEPSAGFGGDRYIISKFGLEMRETINFIVSRRRFNEMVRYNGYDAMPQSTYTEKEVRPMEGDLIYLPLTNDIFQIMFSEHESVFYQLGYRYIWRLNVQKFDYSSEKFQTGVPEVDRIQDMFENINNSQSDPLAQNADLKKKATEVLDVSRKNIFGDPE